MPFYNPKDRQVKDLVPGMHIRTFWGEQQSLSLVELDANIVLPGTATRTNKAPLCWKASWSSSWAVKPAPSGQVSW